MYAKTAFETLGGKSTDADILRQDVDSAEGAGNGASAYGRTPRNKSHPRANSRSFAGGAFEFTVKLDGDAMTKVGTIRVGGQDSQRVSREGRDHD